MRNPKKSRERDADDSSSINRLPDEIILQILNKIIDLRSLCFCYLLSKRFSSIVLEVDAVSFTAPFKDPNIPNKNPVGDISQSRPCHPKLSAHGFLRKFTGVKSLYIELPFSDHRVVQNRCLFKWRVKFGSRVESFVFLSPNYVCDNDGIYQIGKVDEENELISIAQHINKKRDISYRCLNDVIAWHKMLMNIVKDLPMLEEVSITDSGRKGRLSLSGEKLNEVKEWVHSASEAEINSRKGSFIGTETCIPVLKLPVSGYVMKGIFCALFEREDIQGRNDFLKNSEDGFEDKEEAAYTEAVKDVLEKEIMQTEMLNALGL
ncbi:hypothetical protein Lser_V15G13700 [Lactuca serriola]